MYNNKLLIFDKCLKRDIFRNALMEYCKTQEEREQEIKERMNDFKPGAAFGGRKPQSTQPRLPGQLVAGQEMKVHHMLVLLLRLRQICCHPALIQEVFTPNPFQPQIFTREIQTDFCAHKFIESIDLS